MKTINTYTASELKDKFPEGPEIAHTKWVDSVSNGGIFWQDEIMDSLKAVFKNSDIKLNDWSISDSSPSYVKFTIPTYWSELVECDELVDNYTGKEALKWIEENLLGQFRYDKKTVVHYETIKNPKRKDGNFIHKKGEIKDCPLTGYCADDDFIDSLLNDIKSGCTLSEAFHNLADVAGKLFYQEYIDQISEEYFIDHADANDFQFTETGKRI